MRILNRNVYVGPSQYAKFPVIRLELDLGALEQWPTARLGDAFIDGLVAALPARRARLLVPRARRLHPPHARGRGHWLGHVLEHVAIELQNVAGEDVTFGKTRSISDDRPGVYSVAYEYAQKEEGIAAGELALKLLDSLLPAELRNATDDSWNWEEERDGFIRYAQRRALGSSTASLVKAAVDRGIPWLRLNEQSLVQPRARQVPAADPRHGHRAHPRTSRWSCTATRKRPTRSSARWACRCRARSWCSRPMPPGARRRWPAARWCSSPTTATTAAASPSTSPREDEVRAGFEAAREHLRSVIVETYLAGDDHRLLVVNGELVAATRRTPGHVVGDGASTVAQLVEVVNSDPRRGVGHEKVLTKLKLDREAELMLERKGYTPDSV